MENQCDCCLSLTNLTELTENYVNLIFSCFSIEILTIDSFQKFICHFCLQKIKQCSIFQSQILESQKILKRCHPSTTSNVDFKLTSDETRSIIEPLTKEEFLSDHDIDYSSDDSSIEENNKSYKIEFDYQTDQTNIIPEKDFKHEPPTTTTTMDDITYISDNSFIENNFSFNVQTNMKVEPNLTENHNLNPGYSCIEKNNSPFNLQTHIKAESNSIENSLIHQLQQNIKPDEPSYLKIRNEFLQVSELSETVVTCELCDETFPNRLQLVSHMELHRNNDRDKYECEICQINFKSIMDLKTHVYMFHLKDKFICDFCGKTFAMKRFLRNHMLLHKDEKKYMNAIFVTGSLNQRF